MKNYRDYNIQILSGEIPKIFFTILYTKKVDIDASRVFLYSNWEFLLIQQQEKKNLGVSIEIIGSLEHFSNPRLRTVWICNLHKIYMFSNLSIWRTITY